LGEIVRAERRAKRILRRHLGVLGDIAEALEQSRTGRLSHRRLMALVGERMG
jgi:hypothetical protein